jgi:hypothetical protein
MASPMSSPGEGIRLSGCGAGLVASVNPVAAKDSSIVQRQQATFTSALTGMSRRQSTYSPVVRLRYRGPPATRLYR